MCVTDLEPQRCSYSLLNITRSTISFLMPPGQCPGHFPFSQAQSEASGKGSLDSAGYSYQAPEISAVEKGTLFVSEPPDVYTVYLVCSSLPVFLLCLLKLHATGTTCICLYLSCYKLIYTHLLLQKERMSHQ